jgi:hypothetical protein
MNPPYDETFEEFARRNGLDEFFNDYSTEVRSKLLSKNLEKPTDIYDVLYSKVREDSLVKNVAIDSNLDENSQFIRDSLLSKHVSNQVGLQESGELYRKNSVSKNKLLTSSKNLEDLGEESRKSALSKNKNLETFFENTKNIDELANIARDNNLSKNNNLISSNLSDDSEIFRENSISKNINKNDNNVELDSENFRQNNISKNLQKSENLEATSNVFRDDNKSKNISNDSDLLNDSETIRQGNIFSNISKESELEESSSNFRDQNISKNKEVNDVNNTLDNISEISREDNLSKNNKINKDLETLSSSFRDDNIYKNKDLQKDLEEFSDGFRKDNINKNVSESIDLDEFGNLSSRFREDNISKNEEKNLNLESTSSVFRDSSLEKNIESKNNLEKLGNSLREDALSKNEKIDSNIESVSGTFRESNLQNNITTDFNLEENSINFRQSNISNNEENSSNLELNSQNIRFNNLSNNQPSLSDLETDSQSTRNDNLSNNENLLTDLETDSESFRENNISNNVPNESNLELSSIITREDNLTANVPNDSNLETDSNSFFNDNIANNSPINSDLENDSLPFLGSNISSNLPIDVNLEADSVNFRQNNLSNNVSSSFDLSAESILYRNDNLSSNIDNTQDLLVLSQNFLNNNNSNNVENSTDLSNLSSIFRNDQLSKNPSRFTLGSNIILANTSFFVGISNLEIQGAIFRNINKAFNATKRSLKPLFDDNESIKFFDDISADKTLKYYSSQGQAFPGGRENLLKRNQDLLNKKVIVGKTLRDAFSLSLVDDTSGPDNGFRQFTKPQNKGELQNIISLYNIEQNTFQYSPRRGFNFNPGGGEAFDELISFGIDSDFQKLLSYTSIEKRRQFFTNTTPVEVINSNNGLYLSRDADEILKPIEGELGSGLSMAAQTNTSDVISDDFDGTRGSRRRGVQHVIDSIKSDDRISFARNFNVQGNQDETSIFIVGKNKDGSLKKSYNRYSIKNPYAPDDALHIEFSLTNYSIDGAGRYMVFPAYIKSYQHGDSASWNSTTFLGRPEPIYTYSNSSRDGSISFFVLTDYATKVDIGYDFNPNTEEVKKITENFDGKNFSPRSKAVAVTKDEAKSNIQNLKEELLSEDLTEEQKKEKELEILKIQTRIGLLETEERKASSKKFYEENLKNGENVYKFSNSFQVPEINGEYIEHKAEDTLAKLKDMKEQLIFQPSYFSGSKADFVERIEFISKLTRPSRNKSTGGKSGFSFTRAPICHLHLGDWFNHDIVVNSVSYDYSDAPWTLDGEVGKTYPMWCNVTINFNIIGTYGAIEKEDAPLSTDIGGFMGRRRVST